MKVGV